MMNTRSRSSCSRTLALWGSMRRRTRPPIQRSSTPVTGDSTAVTVTMSATRRTMALRLRQTETYLEHRAPKEGHCVTANPKQLALQIIEELWNRKIPALIGTLYAANCTIHTPNGVLQGPSGATQLYTVFTTANLFRNARS